MSMAFDNYREIMRDNGYYDESPYCRPHLAESGYEYEDGKWYSVFVNKEVVARKDHPKFNIKKGEKHRYIKIKVICDETGCTSWEVHRNDLTPPPVLNDRDSWYAEGYYESKLNRILNQKG